MAVIVDHTGVPYPAQPRKPVDVASVARVQDPAQAWATALPATPENVFSALTAACAGDLDQYLTLAEVMEERNLHYATVLQTRKLAVTGAEIDVLPGDKSEVGATIAEAFRERVVDSAPFRDMLTDLLDGLGKGFSVVQPEWELRADGWDYRAFCPENPHLFVYDRSTMRKLRIRSQTDPDGIEMRPGQFIVHEPRVRTAIPIRAGLARPASVAYLFHSTTVRQWATFINVFGMPLRLGTYDPASATAAEMDALMSAVVNLGHDAAAILPMGMKIDFPDARRPTSGDNVYAEFAAYWDAALSKLVLGQTMTTEDGSSLAQAKVHNDVRVDLMVSDARQLANTVRKFVASPWVLYNYGAKAPVPHIKLNVEPPEDLKTFSEALTPLISAGMRVRAQEIRDKFGLTEPTDSDEVIEIELPEPAAAPAPGLART